MYMDRVKLEARSGMVYTDGTNFGKTIFLADGEDADCWYEISEEQAEETEGGGFSG